MERRLVRAGGTPARNLGASLARGEFLCSVDSGDCGGTYALATMEQALGTDGPAAPSAPSVGPRET